MPECLLIVSSMAQMRRGPVRLPQRSRDVGSLDACREAAGLRFARLHLARLDTTLQPDENEIPSKPASSLAGPDRRALARTGFDW